MTLIKMSTSKLTINKYEDGANFKSLQITIEESEYSSETKFGEWIDGPTIKEKIDKEKSSRLVVKIDMGDESINFDLDSCARVVSEIDKYFNTVKLYGTNVFADGNVTEPLTGSQESLTNIFNYWKGHSYHAYQNKSEPDCTPNRLEQSLEKVNENNARIMENIHMLNRTLNYTKKKEILDLMCPKPMRTYSCNICGKCFVYETGLKRHHSMRHALYDTQPRWQTVWTCVQCFQVWPRQDQGLKHSSECCKSNKPDCIRDIKTSSLLQCEFCEKVFTSIPRLLWHCKTHSPISNYQCNPCETTFSSYKTAEQHWSACLWQKMNYNFSLPKMLLCNACDRKFRNYDQLYIHRYKVSHFMMKTHCSQENNDLTNVLVYQCEICSQCFSSVSELKKHRSQFHTQHKIGIKERIDNLNYEYYLDNEFVNNQMEDK